MPFSNIQTTGRPLVIKDEGVSLNSDVASIDFAGTGVSGSAIGNDVTEDIAGSMENSEALVGTVDGTNKVFTVSNPSKTVFANGILQTETEDYTLSNGDLTITFNTAPPIAPDGTKTKLRSFY